MADGDASRPAIAGALSPSLTSGRSPARMLASRAGTEGVILSSRHSVTHQASINRSEILRRSAAV